MVEPQRPSTSPREGLPQIRRVGLRERSLGDLYHYLLEQRWGGLFALALGAYVLMNLGFGLAYYELGGVTGMREGSFVDAVAFSMQTLTTIGYGAMAPTSPIAHALAGLEVFLGLLGFALITGMIFAKFSRPTARVMFSDKAVITVHDGAPCFMFRMANERVRSRIVEAELRVTLLLDTTTEEGVFMRRFFDMPLARSRTPLFALSWTALHPIDGSSPLRGATPEWLRERNAEVLVSFVGLDETMSQTLHGRFSYGPDRIVFGARLADVLEHDERGRLFNYRRFHEVVPVDDDVVARLQAL